MIRRTSSKLYGLEQLQLQVSLAILVNEPFLVLGNLGDFILFLKLLIFLENEDGCQCIGMHFMRNWTNRQKKKDKCSLNGNQNDPFPFMPSFYGNRKIDSLLSFACSFSTLRPLGAFHFATFAMTDLI